MLTHWSQVHTNSTRTNKLCGRPPQYAPPLQVDNIFVFIRQVAGLFRHVGYLIHQQQVDLFTLKVVPSHV